MLRRATATQRRGRRRCTSDRKTDAGSGRGDGGSDGSGRGGGAGSVAQRRRGVEQVAKARRVRGLGAREVGARWRRVAALVGDALGLAPHAWPLVATRGMRLATLVARLLDLLALGLVALAVAVVAAVMAAVVAAVLAATRRRGTGAIATVAADAGHVRRRALVVVAPLVIVRGRQRHPHGARLSVSRRPRGPSAPWRRRFRVALRHDCKKKMRWSGRRVA